MSTLLVGVDCATDPKKTGLARATLEGKRLVVHEARVATTRDDLVDAVAAWLAESDVAVLALDAPLGWPDAMRSALPEHVAGAVISAPGNEMFQRETDRFVHRTLGKKPLEVGANLIARTALAALALLSDVRVRVPISVGWFPGAVAQREAIEVYPAATLISRGISSNNYKKPADVVRRREILRALDVDASNDVRAEAARVDHVLDAILCCLAAADYVAGAVSVPTDLETAKREGWIWFRSSEAKG